jgi:hypothetical protein
MPLDTARKYFPRTLGIDQSGGLLRSDCACALRLAQRKTDRANWESGGFACDLVAGTGFEPVTFRL